MIGAERLWVYGGNFLKCPGKHQHQFYFEVSYKPPYFPHIQDGMDAIILLYNKVRELEYQLTHYFYFIFF